MSEFTIENELGKQQQVLFELDMLRENVLPHLPKKLKQETMIPMGKHAFIPGHLERTNEVLVKLGPDMFVWRAIPQAQEILAQRHVEIQHRIKYLQERLGQQQPKEVPKEFTFGTLANSDGTIEIREKYDPEQERLATEQRKKNVKTALPPVSKEAHQNLMAKWADLMKQEQQEEDPQTPKKPLLDPETRASLAQDVFDGEMYPREITEPKDPKTHKYEDILMSVDSTYQPKPEKLEQTMKNLERLAQLETVNPNATNVDELIQKMEAAEVSKANVETESPFLQDTIVEKAMKPVVEEAKPPEAPPPKKKVSLFKQKMQQMKQ